MSNKTHMHGGGESYSGVIPAKQPNKSGKPPAEVVEGRPLTKENAEQSNLCWTPSQRSGPNGLDRVRKAAKKDGKLQFTALLHHVNIDLLRDSYHSLKKQAAPGVDGVRWEEYGQGLEARLRDLHGRIHRGNERNRRGESGYRNLMEGNDRWALRRWKTKSLSIGRWGTVLNQISGEEDFLGFSYGFRPGRSQHVALDALYVGIVRKKVNWCSIWTSGRFR